MEVADAGGRSPPHLFMSALELNIPSVYNDANAKLTE